MDLIAVPAFQRVGTVKQDTIIGAIASAEIEAKRGNGAKALQWLSKTGKWAYDTAKQIGTKVAAEVIKSFLIK